MNWQDFKRGAFFTVLFAELVYIIAFFFMAYKASDHAEHLHASWLVWQGEIPYKDFFEHHHPLLWYLAAPLVALFYKNVMIFYVAQLVNAFAYIVMFIGLYRISCDFLKTSQAAFVLALMLFLLHPSFLSAFFEFAPDAFMLASFVWGLWFYFKFLENKQQKYLNICFILWTIAFLFLQKVLFLLIVMGGYTLYLMIKKGILLKNILQAVIMPLIVIGLFLFYFSYHQAIPEFIALNYEFNFWMCKLIGGGCFPKITSVVIQISIITFFCLYDFLRVSSKYRFIFAGLIVGDFVFKWITCAPWVQYFVFIEFGGLLIISQEILSCKYRKIAYFLLVLVICLQLISFKSHPVKRIQNFYLNLQNYIMTNSFAKDDIVINGNGGIFNIYGKNPHYYWFGYQDVALLAYYLYGYGGKFDINDMIVYYRPVFLFKIEFPNNFSFFANLRGDYHKYLENLYDKFPNQGEGKQNFANYWNQKVFYQIDDEIFDKYYKPTKKPYLFIRKDAPELNF